MPRWRCGDDHVGSAMLSLRPTLLSDLDFVVLVETDQHTCHNLAGERTQHEGALRFPDSGTSSSKPAVRQGRRFCHPAGVPQPARSVELKRLVRRARARAWAPVCAVLKRMAFRDCMHTASGSM